MYRILVVILILAAGCSDDDASNNANNTNNGQACGTTGQPCPDGLTCVTTITDEQTCVAEPEEALLLIKDASLSGACVGGDDLTPGADVAWVHLLAHDQTTVIGWGRMVLDQPGDPVGAQGTPLDGTPRTDRCDGYNIGCEGKLLIEFVDADGSALKIGEGQIIQIQEGGDMCDETFVDGMEAFVCTNPENARNEDFTECDWELRLSSLSNEGLFGGTVGNTLRP